jgi:hypothetical protein
MRIDHDGIFKQLLEEFFVEFLDLFVSDAAQLIDPRSITFLDKEVFHDLFDPDQREADLLAQVRFREQPTTFLIHVEHQAQEDSVLHQRMFRYFAKFHNRYDAPLYPIALCSYLTPHERAPDRYTVSFPEFSVLDFRFRVVQLNQFRWRDYLKHPNPLATALLSRMQVGTRERRAVKAACLAHLAGLPVSAKRRRIISQFLEVYLPLAPTDARQLQSELPDRMLQPQENIMTGIVTSWERFGAIKMIVAALDQRFGPLPDTVKEQIDLYPFELLETLNLAQFSFATVDDLHAWLADNPVPPWIDPLGEWDEDEEQA